MRTVTLIPSHVDVSPGEVHGRVVGLLTLVGSGDFANVQLEVVLDAATLGGVEAKISECRDKMRATVG